MFDELPLLPPDPILGLSAAYKADSNPDKVDLSVGIYKNDQGDTPIMEAVKIAQEKWAATEPTKAYAPPAGFEGFNVAMQGLLLGNDSQALKDERAISVQTPGGCGALRVAAGMLMRAQDKVKVWVSTPTWANHLPLLGSAGIDIAEYPYYDYDNHRIDFDAMMETLKSVQVGELVLLHGCCHNPSGADLSQDQWRAVTALLKEKGATPFIDVAYLGLGDGLDEDAWGLRHMVEQCPEVLIAASCSKNFGLYRERVGAVVVVARTKKTAAACRGQLVNIAREIYSMPPSHGAGLVDIIFHTPDLMQLWQKELGEARNRINDLRADFVSKLQGAGFADRFDYIQQEKGMFSFLGISKEQVAKLKNDYSIYMVGSSRINVAGLNADNMDYVVSALTDVI